MARMDGATLREELARLQQPPYDERVMELKNANQFAGLVDLVPLLKPFA